MYTSIPTSNYVPFDTNPFVGSSTIPEMGDFAAEEPTCAGSFAIAANAVPTGSQTTKSFPLQEFKVYLPQNLVGGEVIQPFASFQYPNLTLTQEFDSSGRNTKDRFSATGSNSGFFQDFDQFATQFEIPVASRTYVVNMRKVFNPAILPISGKFHVRVQSPPSMRLQQVFMSFEGGSGMLDRIDAIPESIDLNETYPQAHLRPKVTASYLGTSTVFELNPADFDTPQDYQTALAFVNSNVLRFVFANALVYDLSYLGRDNAVPGLSPNFSTFFTASRTYLEVSPPAGAPLGTAPTILERVEGGMQRVNSAASRGGTAGSTSARAAVINETGYPDVGAFVHPTPVNIGKAWSVAFNTFRYGGSVPNQVVLRVRVNGRFRQSQWVGGNHFYSLAGVAVFSTSSFHQKLRAHDPMEMVTLTFDQLLDRYDDALLASGRGTTSDLSGFNISFGPPSSSGSRELFGQIQTTSFQLTPGEDVVVLLYLNAGSLGGHGLHIYDSLKFETVPFTTPDGAAVTSVYDPVEPPLAITACQILPSGFFHLLWGSVIGERYQVEQRHDLLSGEWVPAGDVITAQSNETFSMVPIAGSRGFFRVRTAE